MNKVLDYSILGSLSIKLSIFESNGGYELHEIDLNRKDDLINFSQIISYSQLSFLCNIICLHKVTIK